MIATAEIDVSLAGDPDLLFGHRLDADPGPLDERIQPPPGAQTGLIVDDDSCLQ